MGDLYKFSAMSRETRTPAREFWVAVVTVTYATRCRYDSVVDRLKCHCITVPGDAVLQFGVKMGTGFHENQKPT